MNQNAEILGVVLGAQLEAVASIRWWHVALLYSGAIVIGGLAIYGLLHLLGVA